MMSATCALALFALLLVPGLQAQQDGKTDGSSGEKAPAIQVGSETLSQNEFKKRVDSTMKRMSRRMKGKKGAKKRMQQMRGAIKKRVQKQTVQQMVLKHHAKKSDVSVPDEEVESKIQNFVKRFGSRKKLEKRLKQSGHGLEQFRSRIRDRMLVDRFVEKNADTTVSDKEVRSFYDRNKKKFKGAKFKKMKSRIRQQLKRRKSRKAKANLTKKLKKKTKVEINISS